MNYMTYEPLSMQEKVNQMQEDAVDDIADAEVPEDESGLEGSVGHQLRRTIKSQRQPVKVPKVFISNQCRFNCAYCGCRAGNEQKQRYHCAPREIAEIAVKDAVQNGHGVFVTSSIYQNADYTEELIIEAIRIMREELHYKGYIHAKVMPGTDPLLIQKAGQYANRLSINIEVSNSRGYELLAKQKNKDNILKPMYVISELIRREKENKGLYKSAFATSQTTQLMAGSIGEDDRTIITLSEALYRKFNLSRVYYTAFHYDGSAKGYDLPPMQVPKWRMYRLYQADRLMQLYGFQADDVMPEEDPLLQEDIDPKLQWAFRHMELYPVEINRADYETLLRVPGIGVTYAKRIIAARKYAALSFQDLQLLRISLKKCRYFITCQGKRYEKNLSENREVLRKLLGKDDNQVKLIG